MVGATIRGALGVPAGTAVCACTGDARNAKPARPAATIARDLPARIDDGTNSVAPLVRKAANLDLGFIGGLRGRISDDDIHSAPRKPQWNQSSLLARDSRDFDGCETARSGPPLHLDTLALEQTVHANLLERRHVDEDIANVVANRNEAIADV